MSRASTRRTLRRPWRTGLLPLAAAAVIVLGAAAWTALGPGGVDPPDSHAPDAGAAATSTPLGVYVGPGGAAAAASVSAQLGGRVGYALDFLPDSSWSTLTDPSWLATRWSGTSLDLVLGVPMLPHTGATLAQGAAGLFDPEFRLLAQRLVATGLGSVVLMVGYQPDDEGSPWYVRTGATAARYVTYWDAIESTMAAVAGAHFVFEWDAGDAGTSPVSVAAMYPGDAAVDIVATDAFDVVPSDPAGDGQWTAVENEPYGPAWMATFAAAHHKPMAIAMWGEVPKASGGIGDSAGFVSQFLQWAASEKLQMAVLWDEGTWQLTGGGFPAAEAALVAGVDP